MSQTRLTVRLRRIPIRRSEVPIEQPYSQTTGCWVTPIAMQPSDNTLPYRMQGDLDAVDACGIGVPSLLEPPSGLCICRGISL